MYYVANEAFTNEWYFGADVVCMSEETVQTLIDEWVRDFEDLDAETLWAQLHEASDDEIERYGKM